MRPAPRIALAALAGASSLVAVPALGAPVAPAEIAPAKPTGPAARQAALDAAAAWRDSLEATRAPALPTPGDAESVILILRDPPAAAADPADRAAAARALTARQDALVPTLTSLGATVTFRYRMLVDAIAVRLPAGRLDALAALSDVAAVVPVTYLAPAQAGSAPAPAAVAPGSAGPPAVAGAGPLHIALIDAGVDVAHPWLGGGMGPTFPVIGGADLVDGDADPSPGPGDPALEAHGTEMASLVLRSPALEGLAPERVPRLLAYRVVAPEPVGGRLRPLARTDRVLAALERAVDPDGDGNPADGAQVILLGLSQAFAGGGADPVADALASADRLGATVVAPVGNDGPTFSRPGAVGGPAAVPSVLAVGGLSAPTSARTADLDVAIGPAAARLGPLPLMGPEPAGAALPVVVLRDDAGVSAGASAEAFADAGGASRVRGALVVVTRGSGSIAQTAAFASAAGAGGLAVWDEDGGAGFPAVPGDSALPLPVVGLGPAQGAALLRLAQGGMPLSATLRARAVVAVPETVASFSTWGPTVDGRQKPELVAPAVDREAAWPGRAVDGTAQSAPLTGTSAAAAEVAALALRLRVDRQELGPHEVRALMIQAAHPLRAVALERQGAGVAAMPGGGVLRIEPAVVASTRAGGAARARIRVSRLDGGAGRYVIAFSNGTSETELARDVAVGAGAPRRVELRLPTRAAGRLMVRDASGALVATAPVIASRPARTPKDALGVPVVDAEARLAEVHVRLGLLRRADGRVRNVRLHGVRLALLPVSGGAPLPVTGAKQDADWPAGVYRFLVARRLASGLAAPAGRYRLRVIAAGPDGARLRRVSAPSAWADPAGRAPPAPRSCVSALADRPAQDVMCKMSQSLAEGIRIDGN